MRGTKQSHYSTDFDATQIASYLAMTVVYIFYVDSGHAGLGISVIETTHRYERCRSSTLLACQYLDKRFHSCAQLLGYRQVLLNLQH